MAKLWNKLYPNSEKARSHKAGTKVFLVQSVKAAGKKFNVYAQTASATYFNMALKSERKASQMLKKIHRTVHQSNDDLCLIEDELFVPFLNEVLNLIVWSYASIEAMANNYLESIDDGLLDEPLRDKLKTLLPEKCGKSRLSKKLFNKFKSLEELRDKIIHPRKSYYYDVEKWENCIFYDFLNGSFNGFSKAVHDILNHYKPKPSSGKVVFHNVKRGLSAKPPKFNN